MENKIRYLEMEKKVLNLEFENLQLTKKIIKLESIKEDLVNELKIKDNLHTVMARRYSRDLKSRIEEAHDLIKEVKEIFNASDISRVR